MKVVVLGGTGTLGSALIAKLSTTTAELVCFSRDELKQQVMKRDYPYMRYVVGDIRDRAALRPVLAGADVVFHVAALKHVDVLEANPTEAIKTNLLGTINVAEIAIEASVPHVVFSSTDKAVLPINTYGMTKAISERYLLGLNGGDTKFAVYRWGNVLGSRGSVVHAFAKSLAETGTVSLTDARMTRFWIHIEDAVQFMLNTYQDAPSDRALIPPMKAASVVELAEAIARVLGMGTMSVVFCGIRPGEKLHEVVESNHDYCVRSDTSPRYSAPELDDMLRKVIAC